MSRRRRMAGAAGALVLAGALAMAGALTSGACAETVAAPDSLQARALHVYLDCAECGTSDFDYVRERLTWVNHVRDRAEAEVSVLVTTLDTGGNGTEATLTFIGRGRFAGVDDTLRFHLKPAETDDAIRKALVKHLAIGLMRYVAHTPLADRIAIADAGRASAPSRPVKDRWNNWVYSTSVNGYFSGQSQTSYISSWGSLSASHVTLESKFRLSLDASYNENRYELSDGSRLLSVSRSQEASARYVWGLGQHWSAMTGASGWTSDYSNVALTLDAAGGLEYNAFPYSQSTRRQLRFDYTLYYRHADYQVPTIYFKSAENLAREGLEITLDSKEPWGSSQVSIAGLNYLHDFSKNRLQAYGSVSLRLVEGLSLKLSGNASRIRDQLSLPAGGATDEEILLQRKQLATQYQYYVNVGITYTFGSIYNNVVNARFGN